MKRVKQKTPGKEKDAETDFWAKPATPREDMGRSDRGKARRRLHALRDDRAVHEGTAHTAYQVRQGRRHGRRSAHAIEILFQEGKKRQARSLAQTSSQTNRGGDSHDPWGARHAVRARHRTRGALLRRDARHEARSKKRAGGWAVIDAGDGFRIALHEGGGVEGRGASRRRSGLYAKVPIGEAIAIYENRGVKFERRRTARTARSRSRTSAIRTTTSSISASRSER